ncbi:four-helix bundle copper-binding protein [Pseudomonas sp. BN414]|uniref:four-helix bundle copper-binding protein n=1 Tax=Pseudomonas sp. BN414 TaxID=2567888 RepID=UPI0024558CC2|nr:four-helix bundle copper-binding protein [Pseudomonas sp. BN414]MDH4567586.1 four-helix bundle copper-binding protein [Pseudomonas sp. BN414]
MTEEHRFQTCITACNSCATACESCMAACLTEDRATTLTRCIQLCRDCADICHSCASLMIRESEYASAMGHVCLMACIDCGEECAVHGSNHCQECARACQVCAEECELMTA